LLYKKQVDLYTECTELLDAENYQLCERIVWLDKNSANSSIC
jgi:hypothetical protein